MTLGDLIRKAREVGDQFSTYEVPLYDDEYEEIQNITFEPEEKVGKWFVQMTVKKDKED